MSTNEYQTHKIRNMFDSYGYSFRVINLEKKYSSDSNHSSKFTTLAVVAFTKEEKRKRQVAGEYSYCSIRTRIILIL